MTGTTTRTVCTRALCGTPTTDPYCSPQCAAIDATRAWWDKKQATAVMGDGAAVVQAGTLDWLDVRVRGEASC